jgi:hypothetical protein
MSGNALRAEQIIFAVKSKKNRRRLPLPAMAILFLNLTLFRSDWKRA